MKKPFSALTTTVRWQTRRRRASLSLLFGVVASAALVVGVTQAGAVVVDAAPTWPIPVDAPAAPPPAADFPSATESSPPAEEIADPVTPSAACGGWYLQSAYGDRWPVGSTWWEYRCTYEYSEYHNTCPGPACDAFCPSCYWQMQAWTNYFFWDGSDARFYGEAYTNSVVFDSEDSYFSSHWWDAPTAQWYAVEAPSEPPNVYPTPSFTSACFSGSCSFDGSSSADSDGTIESYEWEFGDGRSSVGSEPTAGHSYASPGSYTVTLTVIDDLGAAGSTTNVVMVELPNTPPAASFASSCSGLACNFDASASADPDGTIVAYSWDFGDGGSVYGELVQHGYAQPGTYAVTLTVTDDVGATATVTNAVLVIDLTAAGYKVKGLQKVDVFWTVSSQSFDVYRNGVLIATVAGEAYTDNVDRKGAGSYVYKVCARRMNTCSNEVIVNF